MTRQQVTTTDAARFLGIHFQKMQRMTEKYLDSVHSQGLGTEDILNLQRGFNSVKANGTPGIPDYLKTEVEDESARDEIYADRWHKYELFKEHTQNIQVNLSELWSVMLVYLYVEIRQDDTRFLRPA
ncbi:hypothetical protein Q0M94_24925 (plasmid) [Deinococcus radiomollis]|uniref:hypothetical protein n=1 Tax=Deinococcus radiomollis TaxID=468916 RepID=UPI003891CA7B